MTGDSLCAQQQLCTVARRPFLCNRETTDSAVDLLSKVTCATLTKSTSWARAPPRKAENDSAYLHLNRPPPNLVALQAFKQRFEVALAKTLVGFALDELKEDRAEQGLAEDLQQQALFAIGR